MITINPDDFELKSAVPKNLYALFRSMQAIPGSDMLEDEGVGMHWTPLPNPMFRGVWKTRWDSEETESRIDEVLEWFDEHDAPDFFWWTDHLTQPSDLVQRLMERGFDGNIDGDPGMVADLHSLHEDTPTPEGFSIVHATEPEALADWRDVFAAAYQAPEDAGQAWIHAVVATGNENAPWNLYVGYLNSRPVATSILFCGAGVAGIYGVGTIPEARNQGIGSAITVHPLRDARSHGYRFGMLFSSRMSRQLYKRLGFQDTGGTIGVHVLERV